uniref:Bicaudal C homolog 2 n=1 Tax=Lepisosteus oculatus TaxID=7918 RepID=W5N015_LEPOC
MATPEESQEVTLGTRQAALGGSQTDLALSCAKEEGAHTDPEDGGGPAPSDPEWVEERFRIDRKKLETMLHTPHNENIVTGEEFFQKVMVETNTQIKWPSKLKIGAKSKKDPHVKVEGKKYNVLEAKKKILELLETKVNKATLKMDVAYTEHSHVIGKGGSNIKKVMEETGCHIHFPDSNRNSVNVEKSNQVSIAGPVSGVESARRRIRELQPLVLSFDLPVGMVPQTVPDVNSPVIQHIVQTFNVTISFRQQPKFYSTTCTVRGLQGNCCSVKKATCVLIELLIGADVSVTVSTQLDITSQQHLFLIGQNGANFINIMHMTQTQIVLPELNAPQSRSMLLIQGTTDSVCLAKQQLLDCLPICLMFDMKEDGDVDPSKLSQMMQNLGVFISVKPKVKQTTKSVVVKTLERNVLNLYEVRRLLLGLETIEVPVAVKPTCDIPLTNGLTNYWLNLIMQQLGLADTGKINVTFTFEISIVIKNCNTERTLISNSSRAFPTPEAVVSALLQVKTRLSPPPGLSLLHEEGKGSLKRNGLFNFLFTYSLSCPSTDRISDIILRATFALRFARKQIFVKQSHFLPQASETKHLQSSSVTEQPNNDNSEPKEQVEGSSSTNLQIRSKLGGSRTTSHESAGSQNLYKFLSCSVITCDTKYKVIISAVSFRLLKSDEDSDADTVNNVKTDTMQTTESGTASMKTETIYLHVLVYYMPFSLFQEYDYEKKKLLATRAMQKKPVVTEVRTPTDTWSGLGFSKSMPAEAAKELRCVSRRNYRSYLDNSSTQTWSLHNSLSKDKLTSGSNSENWRERREPAPSSPPPSSSSSSSSSVSSFPASEAFLSCSNYFESVSSLSRPSSSTPTPTPQHTTDLPELFSQLGLGKYIDIFQQQEIDFQTFLTLSDEDLKEVGISTFGARRKMLLAISEFNKNKKKFLDPPAVKPGYLEGGASGRLPRIVDMDIGSQSNCW